MAASVGDAGKESKTRHCTWREKSRVVASTGPSNSFTHSAFVPFRREGPPIRLVGFYMQHRCARHMSSCTGLVWPNPYSRNIPIGSTLMAAL